MIYSFRNVFDRSKEYTFNFGDKDTPIPISDEKYRYQIKARYNDGDIAVTLNAIPQGVIGKQIEWKLDKTNFPSYLLTCLKFKDSPKTVWCEPIEPIISQTAVVTDDDRCDEVINEAADDIKSILLRIYKMGYDDGKSHNSSF